MAVGGNGSGQCNVDDWMDIVAIGAGGYHTVGLKKDGTVVAVGYNEYGQCDVGEWTDMVAVSAGDSHTVGLKKDGTVVAVGDNSYGQCDVGEWTDIVAVGADYYHTVGLKKDGTVVAVSSNLFVNCNVGGWTDIIAISTGDLYTVGLKKDGTVVAVGPNDNGQCDVEAWQDIVAISAGSGHTVGLKADGTVVAVGPNDDGQCDVEAWQDIVAISAGGWHTVGLKADGTVVAVGNNGNGRCDVESPTNNPKEPVDDTSNLADVNLRLSETSGKVTWDGTGPWTIMCTADGHIIEEVTSDVAEYLIEVLVPDTTYCITVKKSNGTVHGIKEFTTETAAPFTCTYEAMTVNASDLTAHMCTIESPNQMWTSSNYSNTFKIGEKAGILLSKENNHGYSADNYICVFAIYAKDGTLVAANSTANEWYKMWPYGNSCQLEIPSMPTNAGEYTLHLFFNNQLVTTQHFTITK